MAFFVGAKPLEFVTINGEQWLLPGVNPDLAPLVDGMADYLRRYNMQEGGAPFWGRRKFLEKAGGRIRPVIETDLLKAGFCPNLDGSLVSLIHKPSGVDLLPGAPAGKGRLGGIHHSLRTRWGAVEWNFTRDNSTVTARGSAAVSPWYDAKALFHQKSFALTDRGLHVEAELQTVDKDHQFRAWGPDYGLSLPEPYVPEASLRLRVPDSAGLRAACVSGDYTVHLVDAATSGFLVDVARIEEASTAQVRLILGGLAGQSTLELALGRGAWSRIVGRCTEEREALSLTLTGVGRRAVLGKTVSLGDFDLNVVPGGALPAVPAGKLDAAARANRTLRVAADGSGHALSLGQAVALLPGEPWKGDWTIEVDAGADLGTGYTGVTVPDSTVEAAGRQALRLRSVDGRAWINGTLQCQRMPVIISGFRFASIGKRPLEAGVAGPGPGSTIKNNRFENLDRGISLTNYKSHPGLVIEQNLFRRTKSAISDAGAAHGGTAEAPAIIRNNVFLHAGGRSIHVCRPQHMFVIHNTFVDSGIRTDESAHSVIASNLFIRASFVLIGEPGVFQDNMFHPQRPAALPRAAGKVLEGDDFASADSENPWRPAPGSELIDAGRADLPVGKLDFRGALRVVGDAPDVGAWEVQE
jgi:hypothetical protein